jgi:hypothetical protein
VNETIIRKTAKKQEEADELRPEYDFSALKNGVRGKYAARFSARTNLVLLSPDIAKYFPDEQSVKHLTANFNSRNKTPSTTAHTEHDQPHR